MVAQRARLLASCLAVSAVLLAANSLSFVVAPPAPKGFLGAATGAVAAAVPHVAYALDDLLDPKKPLGAPGGGLVKLREDGSGRVATTIDGADAGAFLLIAAAFVFSVVAIPGIFAMFSSKAKKLPGAEKFDVTDEEYN
mmetsp:Transcript_10374/g.30833  ORF Transcript_10374/g.30833 Transcript_10374/m.30833 type:complete len:139 (-) Transcript_10374:89-505(-)